MESFTVTNKEITRELKKEIGICDMWFFLFGWRRGFLSMPLSQSHTINMIFHLQINKIFYYDFFTQDPSIKFFMRMDHVDAENYKNI